MNHSTKYVLERLIDRYPDLCSEVLDMQERETIRFKEFLIKQTTAMIAPHILTSVVPDVNELNITEIAKQYLG